MNQRADCPVCGYQFTTTFLVRKRVPVHQNLLVDDPHAAVNVARGDLTMAVCRECGFLFNQTFDLSLLSYGASYDNTQECSPTFSMHVDALVDHLVHERGVRDCHIVEVGCGKGSFLRKLVQADGANNRGRGFDPSYEGPASDLGGRVRFERRFYGPDCGNTPADVVVCRHVIEHVPDPIALLRDIRRSLVNSPKARIFFETPCSEWILDHTVIWDFFYEHCSIFSAAALTTAFARAGFRVEKVRHVFGEQYLWLEASVAETEQPTHNDRREILSRAKRFAVEEQRLKQAWLDRIGAMVKRGKAVALWGAGAKGVTFANLIDPTRTLIDCLVDLNPQKQGRYVPGTGHPVVDYRQLKSRSVTIAILMNANYRDEVRDVLDRDRVGLSLFDESTFGKD